MSLNPIFQPLPISIIMSPAASSPNREIAQEPFPTKVSSMGEHYFFGIGINTYTHFSRLHNATRDVKGVAEVLHRRYQFQKRNIVLLLDEDATRDNIICQLDAYQEMLSPKDRLLIYYSGHGHLNQKTERGYWIPVDAVQNKTATYINNSVIKNYIEDIPAKHTLLISDSCFSGALFVRGETRSSLAIEELEQRSSRWAFCSGRHDELVYDGKPGTNSPFSGSIIKVLKRNRNPKINLMKLIDEVIELTRAQYKQLPEGNPLFNAGHEGGQFIFQLQNGETLAWANCQQVNTVDGYQLFLHKYPKGKFAAIANKNLEKLEAIELAKLQQSIIQTSIQTLGGPDMALQMVDQAAKKGQMQLLIQGTYKLQQQLLTWKTRSRVLASLLLIPFAFFIFPKIAFKNSTINSNLVQDPAGPFKGFVDTKEWECDTISMEKPSPLFQNDFDQLKKSNQSPDFAYWIKKDTLVVSLNQYTQHTKIKLIYKGKKVLQVPIDSSGLVPIALAAYQQAPGPYELHISNQDTAFSKTVIIRPPMDTTLKYADQSYETMFFKGKSWIINNLNITVENSWYYRDSMTDYKKFGLLYNQQGAEQACKKLGPGWRLPTSEEWRELALLYGGIAGDANDGGMDAYKGLTDAEGFNAKLGGWSKANQQSNGIHESGGYWSSTRKSKKKAFFYSFKDGKIAKHFTEPEFGFSCRCVKGN